MFLFMLRSLIRTRLSVAGYSSSRVFLCGRRTIFLRLSQRFPQSLLKSFLSQKTWKAGIFVSPSPDDLSKQKHPCWGAISFSFIKKRIKHPEVCPSGKGNSPCRRLASGRTLCGEFANRSCIRKRMQASDMGGFSKTKAPLLGCFCFGGATRNRTGDKGFADLCLTAWLWRLISHTKKCMLYI